VRRPRQTRRRRGATFAESAIILSVFLSMVLGMLDLGIGLFYQEVVSQAARQGARRAIVHGRLAPPKQAAWGPAPFAGKADAAHPIAVAIRPAVDGLIDPSRVDLRVDWLDGGNDVGQRVRVTVSTPWTPIVLFLFGSQPRTLIAASTMPIAH
jgi:hypothetical protein